MHLKSRERNYFRSERNGGNKGSSRRRITKPSRNYIENERGMDPMREKVSSKAGSLRTSNFVTVYLLKEEVRRMET